MSQRFSVRSRLRTGLAATAVGALLASTLAVIGAAPAEAAGASGQAYVTNFAADTVSVIDTSSQTIVSTIAVGNGPQGVVVNHAGTRVYVVNQLARTVTVIDTATNTVVATINIGGLGAPSYAAINSAGTRLYVTDEGAVSGFLYVIDTTTNTVLTTVTAAVPLETRGLDLNGSETGVFIAATNANAVVIVSTATNTIAGTSTVGTAPTDVEFNPAAPEAYVPNNGSSNISVISAAPTATIPTPFGPYFTDFDPTGALAYTSQSVGQISVTDTATRSVIANVAVGGDPWTAKVDPTGTYLYVVNNALDQVQLIDLSSNTVVSTIGGLNEPRDIAFGPVATAADISVGVSAQFLNILSPALTFTLTASNNGPDPVSGATLTGGIPAGVTATNLSSGCTQSAATVSCVFGSIAIGASAQKSFSLPTSLLSLGTVGVTATRTASTPTDPNPVNDTASDSCLVVSIVLAIC